MPFSPEKVFGPALDVRPYILGVNQYYLVVRGSLGITSFVMKELLVFFPCLTDSPYFCKITNFLFNYNGIMIFRAKNVVKLIIPLIIWTHRLKVV